MGRLTLKDVKAISNYQYDSGGDYVIEMLSDAEIVEMFCKHDNGRKRLYDFMRSVEDTRRYIAEQCSFG